MPAAQGEELSPRLGDPGLSTFVARNYTKYYLMAQWGAAAKAKNGGGVVKQTSQRSLLFRQDVNRTEEENIFSDLN